jgi:hypothetical protein
MIAKRNVRISWIASALLGLMLAPSLPSAAQAVAPVTCINTATAFDPSPLPLCVNSGFLANSFINGAPTSLGIPNYYKLFNPNVPPGSGAAADPNGTSICALIYVFDADQDMVACCSCIITGGGGTGASIAALTFNPGGGVPPPDSGTVKVVAAVPTAGCGIGQEKDLASEVVPGGIVGWVTHGTVLSNPLGKAEVPFTDTREDPGDLLQLASLCGGAQGAGTGVCGCPSETTGP